MATNAIQFGINLVNYAKTVPRAQLNTFQKRVVTSLFSRIVDLTPVDKGEAKGNWKIGIGEPAEGAEYVGGQRATRGGDFAANSVAAQANSIAQLSKLTALKGQKIVWISNDTPHIQLLEDGSSHDQAPHGMVAVARAELGV